MTEVSSVLFFFFSCLQRIAAVVYGAEVWTGHTNEGSNIPPQKLVWTTHSDALEIGTQNWVAITSSNSGDKLGLLAEDGALYIGTSNKVIEDLFGYFLFFSVYVISKSCRFCFYLVYPFNNCVFYI